MRKRYVSVAKAFTLIELMVAMTIFSIVMMIASAGYIELISVSKNVQATTDAMNNVSTAFDSMVRDIRTGTCTAGQCAPGSSTSFTFTDSGGCAVTYSVVGSALQRDASSCGNGTDLLTDSQAIKISNVTFNVKNYSQTNSSGTTGEQVWVTILLQGTAQTGPGQTHTFKLETGATTRGIILQ